MLSFDSLLHLRQEEAAIGPRSCCLRGDYAFAWLYVVIWLLLASSMNKMGLSKPFPIVENFVLCTSNRIEVQSMWYFISYLWCWEFTSKSLFLKVRILPPLCYRGIKISISRISTLNSLRGKVQHYFCARKFLPVNPPRGHPPTFLSLFS